MDMELARRDIADVRQKVGIGSAWVHLKRGSAYCVEAVSIREEDGAPMVVYRDTVDGTCWVRPAAEFLDGRFERSGVDIDDLMTAARSGLEAFSGTVVTEDDRTDYLSSLQVVADGIDLVIPAAMGALRDFLRMVIDGEMQSARHIVVDDEEMEPATRGQLGVAASWCRDQAASMRSIYHTLSEMAPGILTDAHMALADALEIAADHLISVGVDGEGSDDDGR